MFVSLKVIRKKNVQIFDITLALTLVWQLLSKNVIVVLLLYCFSGQELTSNTNDTGFI